MGHSNIAVGNIDRNFSGNGRGDIHAAIGVNMACIDIAQIDIVPGDDDSSHGTGRRDCYGSYLTALGEHTAAKKMYLLSRVRAIKVFRTSSISQCQRIAVGSDNVASCIGKTKLNIFKGHISP